MEPVHEPIPYFPCSSRQQSVTWTVPSAVTVTLIEFAVRFVTRTPPIATVSFEATRRDLPGTRTPQFTARDFRSFVRSADGRPSESAIGCFAGEFVR